MSNGSKISSIRRFLQNFSRNAHFAWSFFARFDPRFGKNWGQRAKNFRFFQNRVAKRKFLHPVAVGTHLSMRRAVTRSVTTEFLPKIFSPLAFHGCGFVSEGIDEGRIGTGASAPAAPGVRRGESRKIQGL